MQRKKPRGVVRIAALGDSVTFGFGVKEEETFPAYVAAALSSDIAPDRVEWINGGVPGFTSLQGLRYLDRVLAFHPDVVTVLYGWNDGWRTTESYAARTSIGREIVESSAVLTFGRQLTSALGLHRILEAGADRSSTFPFVPLKNFEANLLKISNEVRRAGAIPVLLTAPAAFGPHIPPDSYFDATWMVPRGQLEPTRQLYADAVRRVAAAHWILLVDCARLVPSDPRLFLADGYHPNKMGQQAMAETIVTAVRNAGLLAAIRPESARAASR